MKPKIIHIVPGKANPNRLNGVNKVVYSVASEIHKIGNEVEVWGITHNTERDIEYPFILQLFKAHLWLPYLPCQMTHAILKQQKDTIFHLHGVLNPVYVFLTLYLRAKGFAYVMTAHGALLKKSLRRGLWYKYPYLHVFERLVLKHAKYIHCITEQERKELPDFCKSSKIRMIPNGVPAEALRKPVQPKHEEPVFLYMGRFDKDHKGLDILLHAFSMLHQKTRKGELILAGYGKDQSWIINRVAELHLSHKITLLPPQFGNDKDRLMLSADVFVHPSRWDVLPTVTLEAAALGKPLIVGKSAGYGSKLYHYHAGWSVHTEYATELAQKLMLAYKKWHTHELHEAGLNAQKMIREIFLWPVIVQDYYRKLYDHG